MENQNPDNQNLSALIVIDVQHDFLPGGALAVPGGDEVIPVITRLMENMSFDAVILTQDFHPAGHSSFASSTPGAEPFTTKEVAYGTQVLWPDHCVQGTRGADLALPPSAVMRAQSIIAKGFRSDVDSYSAFMENDKKTSTGLAGMLRERGVSEVVLVGLALDYCVGYSALDARAMGFDVTVVLEGCRGIAKSSVNDMMNQMTAAGVKFA